MIAVKSDVSDTPLDRRNRARFINPVMIAGDKCIALLWKNADPPLVPLRLKNLPQSQKRKKCLFDKCRSGLRNFWATVKHTVNWLSYGRSLWSTFETKVHIYLCRQVSKHNMQYVLEFGPSYWNSVCWYCPCLTGRWGCGPLPLFFLFSLFHSFV